MKTIRWTILMCGCIFPFGCAIADNTNPTVEAATGKDRLAPCPKTQNCVSSIDPMDAHYIAPLSYTGSKDDAYRKLVALIASCRRTRLVVRQDNYLRAEFRSAIFRFVDDVEFLFSEDHAVIHVRSASRVGYYDFGMNRRRIEDIRNRWRGG